jgi:predicted MPP superfamily phosphohydrolase
MPVRYGLIEPEDLPLPQLPEAIDGLRVAHVSDIHVSERGNAAARRRLDRLGNQLTALKLDLVLFTGDYMITAGDEDVTEAAFEALCDRLRPSIGMFGVFGNHDSAELRERLARMPIHWLHNQAARLATHPIEIWGLGNLFREPPDAVALAIAAHDMPPPPPAPRRLLAGRARVSRDQPLRMMLAHYPSCLTTAADMNVDLLLSGHTHGGQIRLPGGQALINACDLPLNMSSGLLRHRNTLAAISRGLGEVGFPRTRAFCPPHAPVYTLRRRSMPGRYCETFEVLRSW